VHVHGGPCLLVQNILVDVDVDHSADNIGGGVLVLVIEDFVEGEYLYMTKKTIVNKQDRQHASRATQMRRIVWKREENSIVRVSDSRPEPNTKTSN
jgi:hypothetical protein